MKDLIGKTKKYFEKFYEIGEINDHIQAEAGHGANIIMGVGEDQAHGEAISVTIIATGFDAHHQNEITNVEPSKVVHALEDEQTMEHDLTALDFESTQKEILDGDDEAQIVYDLENDIEELSIEDSEQLMDLIPTTEFLKGIEVDFEDVLYDSDDEEFIINTIEPEAEVSDSIANDEQTSLTLDLPISNTINPLEEGVEIFQLEDNVNNIEVDDFIELVAVSEVVGVGEETFTLDDHIVIQQTNKKFDPSLDKTTDTPEVEVEEEMVLTKVTVKERKVTPEPKQNTNPFESPISKTLRDRANDRRQKMKAFNYKFNASKIEEFENEPAYKRQGIELSDGPEDFENQVSRTSVTSNENEDIQVRSNNSFLHDNVD